MKVAGSWVYGLCVVLGIFAEDNQIIVFYGGIDFTPDIRICLDRLETCFEQDQSQRCGGRRTGLAGSPSGSPATPNLTDVGDWIITASD